MKNLIYWKLLIVIFFFGCGGADDSSSDNNFGRYPISPGGSWISEPNEDTHNEDTQEDEQLQVEEILAELEEMLIELEEVLAEVPGNAQENEPPVQDFDAPKMTGSSVALDAENVSLNRVIWIEFDEPIDEADITLQTEDGNTVETRVIFRNQKIEIRRFGRGKDFHLKPLTTYIISGTVADAAGNETKVELTFTTGEEFF